MLVQLMQGSLAVQDRSALATWLRDDLGQVLPNIALVCIAGNLARRRYGVEVLARFGGEFLQPCTGCKQKLVSTALLDHWVGMPAGSRAGVFASQDVIDGTCDCPSAQTLRSASSVLVQGIRDERSGEDAIYLLFGTRPVWDEHHLTLFSLLLPQIDVASRRVWLPKDGGIAVGNGSISIGPASREWRDDSVMSSREQEVLGWVRAGKTNNEIAQILNISAFTVKNHLQRIYRKIDVINRTQAVAKLEEYARGR